MQSVYSTDHVDWTGFIVKKEVKTDLIKNQLFVYTQLQF